MTSTEKEHMLRKIQEAKNLEDLKVVLNYIVIHMDTDLDDDELDVLGNIAHEQ